jgi:hypothetical protein
MSDAQKTESFLAPERIALIMGYALPWRLAIAASAGTLHPSLFDLLVAPVLLAPVYLRRSYPGRFTPISLLIVLFALLALHPIRPEAPLVAPATVWAALTGLLLARLDADAVLRGLEAGLLASTLTGLVLLPFAPEMVTEGTCFTGFVATKNGYAAFAGILAIRRAMMAGRIDPVLSLVWFGVVLATGSRGGILATIGAAIILILERGRRSEAGGRMRSFWLIALATGAIIALIKTTFPSDRYEFASMIIEHRRQIPLLGIGAGANYGLDLYAKSLLEFGPVGAAILAGILALSLRSRTTRPFIVFLLIFGIAHDPTRWPIFWFLMASGSIRSTSIP